MVKVTKALPSTEEIIAYCDKVTEDTQDLEAAVVATVRHFIIKSR